VAVEVVIQHSKFIVRHFESARWSLVLRRCQGNEADQHPYVFSLNNHPTSECSLDGTTTSSLNFSAPSATPALCPVAQSSRNTRSWAKNAFLSAGRYLIQGVSDYGRSSGRKPQGTQGHTEVAADLIRDSLGFCPDIEPLYATRAARTNAPSLGFWWLACCRQPRRSSA
jgi:hypothetical protein